MNLSSQIFSERKTRIWELVLLAALFFAPRFIFLQWVTHHSTAYQDQTISAREPSSVNDGDWAQYATQILSGNKEYFTSDDIGFSLLMAGLSRLGISLRTAFYAACAMMMGLSFIFLWYLFLYLSAHLEKRIVWSVFLYLCFYPPGVYAGFALVSRMLSVYSFLVCVVLLVYWKEFLSSLSLNKIFLFLGISLFANFLILSRNTNKPIFFALLAALGLKILIEKISFRPYLVFLSIFFLGYLTAQRAFPSLEHSAWHPIYLGLSDFDNKYKIEPRDAFANEKAREANPNLKSVNERIDLHPEYEPTLKKMTLDLIVHDPLWYGRILAMRSLKLMFVPFQGSWMMVVGENKKKEMVALGDLTDGFKMGRYRLYIVLDVLTASIDLLLTLLGGILLVSAALKRPFRDSFPFALLLAGTAYIYALIMVSNRPIFLAATYFYQFFAVLFLSRFCFALWDELKFSGSRFLSEAANKI